MLILEQLEDLGIGTPLLPVSDPQRRASCRLWADHVSFLGSFHNMSTNTSLADKSLHCPSLLLPPPSPRIPKAS
jgi:hypothetical protein